MTIDIEVRSSGWGPRKVVGVPSIANAYWRKRLIGDCFRWLAEKWPRDGVVVIIRRAG